jgi:hypothetical protein
MRALPSEGRGHWFESSRRGHAAIAQLEERSPGTAEVPGSAPGGGSGPTPVLVEPVRLLSAGEADAMNWRVDREERCSLAKRWPRAASPAFDPLPLRLGRYASLAGAPCFESRYTVLPWGFDTSTFRSGAVVQRKHAGPSTRRMSDRNRPASPPAAIG